MARLLASFAVMLSSTRPSAEAILLTVDERQVADEIAEQLRRKGHPVDVHKIAEPATRLPPALPDSRFGIDVINEFSSP